jgi:hypothetical protein
MHEPWSRVSAFPRELGETVTATATELREMISLQFVMLRHR